MLPIDWRNWTSETADPLMRDCLLKLWATEIVPRFAARYATAVVT